jgi:hypothetical protein
MARKPLKIGERVFKFKKDAISFYKEILDKYDFNDSLNDDDFLALKDLIRYDICMYEEEEGGIEYDEDSVVWEVYGVEVIEVFHGKKAFKVIYKRVGVEEYEEEWISYRNIIYRPKYNPFRVFSEACRTTVASDINELKRDYFLANYKNGGVKCQETGITSKWDELVVDHRQPNTFSVIVDRFVELNQIDIKNVEYLADEKGFITIAATDLADKFRAYHKQKATLRVVRKDRNLSRASQAKITAQSKDLKIK